LVIPAGTGERRPYVLEFEHEHVNDKAYFDPIFLQMVEQGGIAAMLHECSGKSDRTCAAHPTTAGLLQQRAHSLAGIDRFLLELATEGEIVSQGSENCHMLRLVGISQSNRAEALSSHHQILSVRTTKYVKQQIARR
jgi:hypothetical protein